MDFLRIELPRGGAIVFFKVKKVVFVPSDEGKVWMQSETDEKTGKCVNMTAFQKEPWEIPAGVVIEYFLYEDEEQECGYLFYV